MSPTDHAPIRVAMAADFPEEGWPSMDAVAEMVLAHLRDGHPREVAVSPVRPPFRRRLSALRGGPALGARFNADRLVNRFRDYPRALARHARSGAFDLVHLIDHSYSQLVPAARPLPVVVTCHDLDTFRCLLEPDAEPRPRWFRAMAARILDGLRRADAVTCVSEATRRAVLAHALVPEHRLHVVPNGIAGDFRADPDPTADADAARRLGGPPDPSAPELLHVGLTIPRKRIDVLLRVVAAARRREPRLRLIRAGQPLTADQQDLARRLGVSDAITSLGRVERPLLAALYRRAAATLITSESEGFGLPVAEALACGTAVVASDLDVLREVGGPAAHYAPVGDVDAWADAVLGAIDRHRGRGGDREARIAAGLERAATFRWPANAARLVEIYRSVLGRDGPP